MPTIALLAPHSTADTVFADRHFDRLREMGTFVDARFTESAMEVLDRLAEVDAIVSTWGMPKMDDAFLARVPRLRGLFYAAGTVKGIVTPASYAHGVVVSSSAPANAVPVAEYTVAVIILANKHFWRFMGKGYDEPREVPGNYRRTVGIIGASMVGRETIRLLKGYDLDILLSDPFVTKTDADDLGVTLCDLPDLMAASDIVSLHAPNLPHLAKMIDAGLLARMQDGATFINTARGALVDEDALLAELQTGRISAVLDVTLPEPPVPDSPLWTLPNVIYTPHIAGSMCGECQRMADFALNELARHLAGTPLRNAVTEAMLARLA
jgi:phosphoglycerate dehydrogenase-like enzyme